jgi:predicted GH43/DUF377 family glycosyl hydrolase
MQLVKRISPEPVVAAGAVPGYGAVFNAGLLHHDGCFHLFARGVRDGYRLNPGDGPRFLDYVSDVLVLTSTDGLHYDFQYVLAKGSVDEVFSYEDPRVQRIRSNGADEIMMTYTNFPVPALGQPWRIGLHRLVYEHGRFQLNRNSGRIVGPHGLENKDAVLFNLSDGRLALIHRIHPDIQLAVFESLDELIAGDRVYWDSHLERLDEHTILRAPEGCFGIGAGAPPVKTQWGQLLFFHERIADGSYTMNVALLDHDTGRVKARLADPILVPELSWERKGDVDDVIFVVGAHRMQDGAIYLSYGAADRVVGAAMAHEVDLMRALGVLSATA